MDITRVATNGVISRPIGSSRWLANARLNYKFDSGFGVGVGPQIWGPEIGASGTYIPTQYRIDSTIYYSTKKWDFQITIYNLTDHTNWTVMDTEFDGGTVIKDKPLSATFTTRYRF